MDTKVLRDSHRRRDLHLNAVDRDRKQRGMPFVSRKWTRPDEHTLKLGERRIAQGDDTDEYDVEAAPLRKDAPGGGKVGMVPRPTKDERENEDDRKPSPRAREVSLDELVAPKGGPKRWRDSYEVVVAPQSRVIALSDSLPALNEPQPVEIIAPTSVVSHADEEWEKIGMDGEVEAARKPKSWASIVLGTA